MVVLLSASGCPLPGEAGSLLGLLLLGVGQSQPADSVAPAEPAGLWPHATSGLMTCWPIEPLTVRGASSAASSSSATVITTATLTRKTREEHPRPLRPGCFIWVDYRELGHQSIRNMVITSAGTTSACSRVAGAGLRLGQLSNPQRRRDDERTPRASLRRGGRLSRTGCGLGPTRDFPSLLLDFPGLLPVVVLFP